MHLGRKPRSEIHNFLNIDPNQGKLFFSEKPDTLPIYSFSGSGKDRDQLMMKTPRRSRKAVSSEHSFYFLEKNLIKGKFEGPYEEVPQLAVAGTKHTVTTDSGKIIHRKRISNPLEIFQEGFTQRGTNPRDSEGRWTKQRSIEDRLEEPGPSTEPIIVHRS